MKNKIFFILITILILSSCTKRNYHYLTESDKEFLGLAVGDTNVFYEYNSSNPGAFFNHIKSEYHDF